MNKITPKDEILSYWAKYNKVRLLKHNKTLVDISEEISIDQGHLSNLLNGKINMYIYRLVQIAEALNCKPADLLPDEWQTSAVQPNEQIYKNIAIVTEEVENYLLATNKKLAPKSKGELIARLCEAVSNINDDQNKKNKICELTDFALKIAS